MNFTKLEKGILHPVFVVGFTIFLSFIYVLTSTLSDLFSGALKHPSPVPTTYAGFIIIQGVLSAIYVSALMLSFITVDRNESILKKVIVSYRFLSKLLYVTLVFLIVTISYDILVHGTFMFEPNTILDPFSKIKNYVDNSIAAITAFVFTILITIRFNVSDFRLKFTRICFIIASSNTASYYDKMKYLMLGLESYNGLLHSKINLQIDNLESLFSKIIFTPEEMNKIIVDISYNLSKGDGSSTLDYIIGLMKRYDVEQPFVRKSFKKLVKEWIPLIGVIISAIVLIGNFILPHLNNTR